MTTIPTSVRLDKDVHDYISKKAKEEDRSFNKMINLILKKLIGAKK